VRFFVGFLSIVALLTVTHLPFPSVGQRRRPAGSREMYILLDLSAQRLAFVKRSSVVLTSRVCAGKEGHETPTGAFSIIRKVRSYQSKSYGKYVSIRSSVPVTEIVNKRTKLYDDAFYIERAKMDYYLEFEPGLGFHAGDVKSTPSSHGCVRLPPESAKRLFDLASVGCSVFITP
jgi:lipoprotein-anchoring transpeptidase ErfK/SrfK